MAGRVDQILDAWFGEPPEHSDDERTRLRNLYEPLRRIEAELDRLRSQVSWETNPDRSGGQFTADEISNARAWR